MQGLQQDVYNMCHAETIEEQKRIWDEKIRPAIFSPMIRKVLNNPMFMWNALGGKCIELLHSHMRYCLAF